MHKKTILAAMIAISLSCKEQPSSTPQHIPPASIQDTTATRTHMAPTIDYDLSYCMGKFDPAADSRFVTISDKHADRTGLRLRKEAYEAFVDMYQAAEADGVILQIRSATRNFDYQKGIWERKWTGKTTLSDGVNAANIASTSDRAKKIMNYSAMPGASRHHWGTDIDLNSFSNEYFATGAGRRVYEWLSTKGHTFGYCQPYTPKETGRTGYNEEKWHWSYTPLSEGMTQFVHQHMHDHDLQGFAGAEAAPRLSVVQLYVLGIDPTCYKKE